MTYPCKICLVRPACRILNECESCKKYRKYSSKFIEITSGILALLTIVLFWFLIIKYTGAILISVISVIWALTGFCLVIIATADSLNVATTGEYILLIVTGITLGVPFAILAAISIKIDSFFTGKV
jgi:hypothetical protein